MLAGWLGHTGRMRRQPTFDGRVILLHGLWMHAPAMHWFAVRLKAQGFQAHALGYYSLLEDTDHAVARVVQALQGAPGSHIVANSLGGLMALAAARQLPASEIGRIVCLGTPLAGSHAAEGVIERVPGGRRLLGRHVPMLLAGAGSLPAGIEVGMIAGSHRRGLGGLLAHFSDDHDGTVAVAETRLPGLADHIVLPASHTGLIFSEAAVAQSAAFLRHGHFEHGPRDDVAGAGIA